MFGKPHKDGRRLLVLIHKTMNNGYNEQQIRNSR